MNKDISSSIERADDIVNRLDNIRKTHDHALEELRQSKFIGVSKEEDRDICSIEINSQYTALEVLFDPYFLKNILKKEMVDTTNIEIDQLVQISIHLGEVAKAAFNDARQKAHTSSQEVFNGFMKTMENLFEDKE